MPKSPKTRRPNWNALLACISPDDRGRLYKVLRRVLKRRLQEMQTGGTELERAAVRSAAVGEWRQAHMKGASKNALRKMGYARLRHNHDYLAIERRLVAQYRERHGSGLAMPPQDVDALSPAQLCKAYRATQPSQMGTALQGLAEGVCKRAYLGVSPDAVRVALGDGLCAALRGERMDGFTLGGASSLDEVMARMRSKRLVGAAALAAFKGRTASHEAARRLAALVRADPEVEAFGELMAALHDAPNPLGQVLERLVRKDARSMEAYLLGDDFLPRAAQALLENPHYATEYRRMQEIKLRVRENVPETPMDGYPLARTMHRHFVLHVGPTNSGKTHDALQALMAAQSGAYLGPLRLLAYEQFDRMNREGCPCSLLTGEERQEVPGARHVSSTVEMANFHSPIRVAVIDEAQMLSDANRGMHWTAAILGIPADEVHVCCAPHAERVVCELVALCDDELEVVRHERLVPLRLDRGGFRMVTGIRPGDALIVFSRRSVHLVAGDVMAAGLRPSLVYGALPYEVRHEEARRFDAGETDVVVATDAIGMGMNLPIRRVVFVEQEKFDGHAVRRLRPEEVQQIAGRAGRFGRYDVGLFQSTRWRKEIAQAYAEPVPDIVRIPVGIPDDIALVREATLSEAIRQWCTIEQPEPFLRVDVSRDLALVGEAESVLDEGGRRERDTKLKVLALATMPFDEDDRVLHGVWLQMVRAELAGEDYEMLVPAEPAQQCSLAQLEADYRMCDLLYGYARTFGHDENRELLTQRRSVISHAIMELLAAEGGVR